MIRAAVRSGLPTGTVTFVFTDVEGSTRLLHELGSADYAAALAEHRRLIRDASTAEGGVEVDTQGDAFFFAFPTAPGALAAAAAFTAALEPGSVRVRVGVHTGTPLLAEEGYVGDDVHRAARIAAAGHGGQVLVSSSTAALVAAELVDLGEHRFKDLAAPERVFQLGDRAFPPLKSLYRSNLPTPANPLVGRKKELADVLRLLTDGDAPLVVLTGPGGVGKTRFAVAVAAEARDAFEDGAWFVPLSPLRDAALVLPAVANAVGAEGDVLRYLHDRRALLVLDNFEHVVDAAAAVADLLAECPRVRVLVTSRETLRVARERDYPLGPLPESPSVELFRQRVAAVAPGLDVAYEEAAAICERLDRLPLAVELAAARTTALTPAQILERLAKRLDLLRGGRDADPRQQTLRATVEWSYDLLVDDERRLFRALAVFSGGCTLEAAEDVAGADLDAVQSLVEKSLVRFTDGRYWMLETIREFALERLEHAGELEDVSRKHAHSYGALAARQRALLESGEPEEGPVSVLAADVDNLRAAVDTALEGGDSDVVRTITLALSTYWIMRGRLVEGRTWLERAVALDETKDELRRRLLSSLGMLAYSQGDHAAAIAASDEAAALATELGGAAEQLALLREQAFAALMRGDLDEAERLYGERLEAAIAVDNGVATSASRLSLASIANKTGRFERAEQLLDENLAFVRSRGQARCEAYTLTGLAETAVHAGRAGECGSDSVLAASLALGIDDAALVAYALDLTAASAAGRGDGRTAGLLLGASAAARDVMDVEPDEEEGELREQVVRMLGGDPGVDEAMEDGRGLGIDDALELARTSAWGSGADR